MAIRIKFFKENIGNEKDTDYSILVPENISELPTMPDEAFENPNYFAKSLFHECRRNIKSFLERLVDGRTFRAFYLCNDYVVIYIPEIRDWVGFFFWRPDEQDVFFNWIHDDSNSFKGPYRLTNEQVELLGQIK